MDYQLNKNKKKDFLVKEDRTINYIVAGVCLTVFIVSFFVGDYGWANFIFGVVVFLVPGIFAVIRARRNAIIIRMNQTGFYYSGKLISSWEQFQSAEVRNEMPVGSFKDNFILDFRYYAPDRSKLYRNIIPLGNTQDKSEEEIIAAIESYVSQKE